MAEDHSTPRPWAMRDQREAELGVLIMSGDDRVSIARVRTLAVSKEAVPQARLTTLHNAVALLRAVNTNAGLVSLCVRLTQALVNTGPGAAAAYLDLVVETERLVAKAEGRIP